VVVIVRLDSGQLVRALVADPPASPDVELRVDPGQMVADGVAGTVEIHGVARRVEHHLDHFTFVD
jgi:hypothetical protein